jgi:hypothetical protein
VKSDWRGTGVWDAALVRWHWFVFMAVFILKTFAIFSKPWGGRQAEKAETLKN